MDELKRKEGVLLAMIETMERAAVAYSGGVDSTLLAAAAAKALGMNAVAVTVLSPTLPAWEQSDADLFAEGMGIRHVVLPLSELDDAKFAQNDRDRCYYCKKFRFAALVSWAKTEGFPWLLEGSNCDDDKDYRPGMRALAETEGLRSPLMEAGFTKEDVRALSRAWGLPSWNKPAAACLASRIAYGTPITKQTLTQVEEAERYLRSLCPAGCQLRVRYHGAIARIEVEGEHLPRLTAPEVARAIHERLAAIGFSYVTVDLAGYRMGSLNDLL